MAAGNSGLGYAGSGFERHPEYERITVCEATVHASGMVGQRWLNPLVSAAAVVLLTFFMVAAALSVAAFVLFALCVAALVVGVIVVVALMLREGVVVL